MEFAIALVVIILIGLLVGTLVLTGKSDENYEKSTKQNTYRLTAVYTVVILISLAALAWYIKAF
jgi:cytochrome c biogenesis protein ResB